MYRVLVRGLEFYAHHGVSEEERAVGHRFLADVTVAVDGNAPETDEIGDTVDYAALGALFVSVATSRKFRTVEALADRLCKEVLASMPLVSEVEVTVLKPLPPAPIIAQATGVTMVQRR